MRDKIELQTTTILLMLYRKTPSEARSTHSAALRSHSVRAMQHVVLYHGPWPTRITPFDASGGATFGCMSNSVNRMGRLLRLGDLA